MKLMWLGGAREIGRSCILLEISNHRFLLDCGISLVSPTQGPFLNKIDASSLDGVIVSHGHLDHSGFVPALFQMGYDGPIYATKPTAALSKLLQRDFINNQKNNDAKGLYWRGEIRKASNKTVALNYFEKLEIAKDISLKFYNAGHILGSSQICLDSPEGRIVYTGDLHTEGNRFIGPATSHIGHVDVLILEATHGLSHSHMPIKKCEKKLFSNISKTVEKGGKVIIPVSAVSRAQNIMVALWEKWMKGELDYIIYLDGLLRGANDIYDDFPEWMSSYMKDIFAKENPLDADCFDEHINRQKVVQQKEPCIILTTSGMADRGPILHYLKELGPDSKNTFIFVDKQMKGSLGHNIVTGQKDLSLPNGKTVKLAASVEQVPFSSHADANGLVQYVKSLKNKPKKIFLCHGNYASCVELSKKLSSTSPVIIPELKRVYKTDSAVYSEEEHDGILIKSPGISFEPTQFQFLVTTPEDKLIREKITELLSQAEEEVLICGHVDTSLVTLLENAVKKGVLIKVISKEISRPDSVEAFKLLFKKKIEFKINKFLHSRLLVIDRKKALLSSADLTRESFYDHYESGILTNDISIVASAHRFFYSIWDTSETGQNVKTPNSKKK